MIALESTDMPFHVQKPDGRVVTLNDAIFADTDRVGVYTLFADDGRELGAVHGQSVGPCGVCTFIRHDSSGGSGKRLGIS